MTLASLALTAVRAALVLGLVLATLRFVTRASAATRRSLLVGGFLIVLALPIATAVMPVLHLRAPAASLDGDALRRTSLPDTVDPPGVRDPTVSTADAPPDAGARDERSTSVSPLVVVVGVWALGAAVVLARLVIGLVRARRFVSSARLVETLVIEGRSVEVRICSAVDTPAVSGLFVPVILLPHDSGTWTAERRCVVVAHELAHVANRDCLASAIAQLAVAMHWFDPLVWIAARNLRIERELAADDRVLAGGVLPSSYAEHLLALATGGRDREIGMLAMAEPSQIEVRIRALLASRARAPLGRGRFALLGAGLTVAGFVACVTPERESMQQGPDDAASGTTLSTRIQRIVDEELDRMTDEWSPSTALVLVLEPETGTVLAAAHRGGVESSAETAADRPMVLGSTMKPLVIAASLEEGAIEATDRFAGSPAEGMLDVGEILAVSSNVGVTRIFDKLGGSKLARWAKRFHFASAPSTIADSAAGAGFATGATMQATPLELTAAFAAFANGGVYHAPTFGSAHTAGEAIMRADTAAQVLALLEGVTGERGTGKAARMAGIRVAGKTGTIPISGTKAVDYHAIFVGAAPLDHPRYVIFVGAETSRETGTGGELAAPVFGRVVTRVLALPR